MTTTSGAVDTQPLERQQIDVRRRLLVGARRPRRGWPRSARHPRPRHDPGWPARRARPRWRRRPGASRPSSAACDDAADARPGRDGAAGDHLGVDGGLAGVPAGDLRALSLGVGRQARRRDELGRQQRGHAFLAAADAQPPAVLLLGPLHGQAELPERLVEGGQVAVSLGVREDPVAVEDERRHLLGHHALPALPNMRDVVDGHAR